MDQIAESLGKRAHPFWDLTLRTYLNLLTITTHKLIDRSRGSRTVSIYSLARIVKTLCPKQETEIEADVEKIRSVSSNSSITDIRNKLTAHLSIQDPPHHFYPSINEINDLLSQVEALVRKYNKWIRGDKYSVDFSSVFAGGHADVLSYISQVINQTG